jgi:hypothetical protein
MRHPRRKDEDCNKESGEFGNRHYFFCQVNECNLNKKLATRTDGMKYAGRLGVVGATSLVRPIDSMTRSRKIVVVVCLFVRLFVC